MAAPRDRSDAVRRAYLSGAIAACAGLAIALGVIPRLIPINHLLAPATRLTESFAPHFLGLGLVLGLWTWALGGRRGGAVTLFTGLAALGQIWAVHRSLSQPLASDRPADMRILFYNVLWENTQTGAAILAAAEPFASDILVFAEAKPLWRDRAAPGAAYPFLSPCSAETCELLIADRQQPARHWQLRLNSLWPERHGVHETQSAAGTPFFLAASHLAKPWLADLAEAEHAQLTAQLAWFPEDRPLMVVGDFNQAPWSLPMLQLLRDTACARSGDRWPPGPPPAGSSCPSIIFWSARAPASPRSCPLAKAWAPTTGAW